MTQCGHQIFSFWASLDHSEMAMRDVRFGSKADIVVSSRNVRFTPESGHWNLPAYYLRRSNSGSLAIFAAIRCASSLVSNLAADRRRVLFIIG